MNNVFTLRNKLWIYYYDHKYPKRIVEYLFPRTGTEANVWCGNERTFLPILKVRVLRADMYCAWVIWTHRRNLHIHHK